MEKRQMSETMRVGLLLAFVGGFLDVYTFLCRDKVFANAQTGNMVLLGVNLYKENWMKALQYFIPIFFFALGTLIVEIIRYKYRNNKTMHWRQITVGVEMIVLIFVSFLGEQWNGLVIALVSMVCAMQVDSFRKLHGSPYVTTMCTGNLRTGTAAMFEAVIHHDINAFFKSLKYFIIIGVFILGGAICVFFVDHYSFLATLFPVFILVIVMILLREEHIE